MKMMTVVTVVALLMSASVFAQESNQDKVICELASGNCVKQADLLRKRIEKLNRNIAKGTKKYSAEDLKKLEQKLKETQDLLDKMEAGK
jgi:hypothetical protein